MAIGITIDDGASDFLEAVLDTFDFTLPGEQGQTLGRDLAVGAAMGIAQRSNQGLDVDGQKFRPNSPDWARYKLDRYQVDRPGELGGQMFSLTSILGTPQISKDLIVMKYGTDEPPMRPEARNGVPLKPEELEPTDVEKAQWFALGGRHFYGLDETINEDLTKIADTALLRHINAFKRG
jgi:hypothetical protein